MDVIHRMRKLASHVDVNYFALIICRIWIPFLTNKQLPEGAYKIHPIFDRIIIYFAKLWDNAGVKEIL